jgi:hypothetical protein
MTADQYTPANDVRLQVMKTDRTLLEAALLGYQAQVAAIEVAISEVRKLLGNSSHAGPAPAKPARRKMSAAGRRKIAEAQKKRWAEYKKSKGSKA